MGAWGFVTLLSPLLYVFEIFHDEQELKKKTSGQQTPSSARPAGALWPSGLLAVPQPQSPLSRIPASRGLVSSKGTVAYVSYFCYLFVC